MISGVVGWYYCAVARGRTHWRGVGAYVQAITRASHQVRLEACFPRGRKIGKCFPQREQTRWATGRRSTSFTLPQCGHVTRTSRESADASTIGPATWRPYPSPSTPSPSTTSNTWRPPTNVRRRSLCSGRARARHADRIVPPGETRHAAYAPDSRGRSRLASRGLARADTRGRVVDPYGG
jgi:hypothetical protein